MINITNASLHLNTDQAYQPPLTRSKKRKLEKLIEETVTNSIPISNKKASGEENKKKQEQKESLGKRIQNLNNLNELSSSSNVSSISSNQVEVITKKCVTTLMITANSGDYKRVKNLIDIEGRATLDIQTKLDKETALMFAFKRGCLKSVKLLIEAGANLEKENIHGQTAAKLSFDLENLEIINEFISSK